MAYINGPIAIGGLGGSGTRVFAELLRSSGFHFGSDLNDAIDNLTFTLLFKRLSALTDTESSFTKLAEIFFSSLCGDFRSALDERDLIFSLASSDRMGHSRDWYLQRVEALLACQSPPPSECFGWKEPNTHVVIDRLLGIQERLKYIHVLRNPYYMAYSINQNQLANWAPIFFGSYVEISPRNALAFWKKAHQRMVALMKLWPGRILMVRYEDLYARPQALIGEIEAFIDVGLGPGVISNLNDLIGGFPAPISCADLNYTLFDEEDRAYVEQHWDQGM